MMDELKHLEATMRLENAISLRILDHVQGLKRAYTVVVVVVVAPRVVLLLTGLTIHRGN
jgi:hypothetical protein